MAPEDVSRMDEKDLKEEIQSQASSRRQQPSRKSTSGIWSHSSDPSMVVTDDGTQLECFQSLTFESQHSREFETQESLCSGSCDAQTPNSTQTHIQAQPEARSLSHSLEETLLKAPLSTQLQKTHFEETENSAEALVEKTGKQREVENKGETEKKIEEAVKGHFEFMTPHGKMAAAASEEGWEPARERSHIQAWTEGHPRPGPGSDTAQLFKISPPWRGSTASPVALRHQEVIVSFEAVDDHMESASGPNVETLSSGCEGRQTRLRLCRCRSSSSSKWVKGHSGPASTPPQHSSTFPRPCPAPGWGNTHPAAQCHQFPKLPSPPSSSCCSNLSEDESDRPGELRMVPGIRTGCGWRTGPQQQSASSSSSNRYDLIHDGNVRVRGHICFMCFYHCISLCSASSCYYLHLHLRI